jgi:hypothetical protein
VCAPSRVRTHLRPSGSQRGFQIFGEARLRRKELRAAQRMAIQGAEREGQDRAKKNPALFIPAKVG